MKIIYKFFAAGITSALLLTACSDEQLTQEPSIAMSEETTLSSSMNVNAVLMGAYSFTGHFRYHTLTQIAMDVMGNDLMMSDGTHQYPTYNWNLFSYQYIQYPRVVDGWWSAYSPYIWEMAYQAISSCNQIISNADRLPEGSTDLLAQAHGLRGWNYLNLYHVFCPSYTGAGEKGQGLFLRQKPGDAKGEDAPRSDLKTSMEFILNDFKYAYEHASNLNVHFINKRAAALLVARTYLDMGKYDEAGEWADKVGSSYDGSDLMSPSEYQAGFNTPNAEWLWGFNFTSEKSNIYASIPSFYHLADSKDAQSGFGTPGYGTQTDAQYLEENGVNHMVGYSTVRAAKSFVNIFGKNDCRALFPFYIDSNDGFVIAKYSSRSTLGVADYPMCRLAEAYLIKAEALLKGTHKDEAKGLEILNTLQQKRNAKVSTQLTSDEIWMERRRELYGEGFALPDIKRLQKPLERVGEDQWAAVKTLPANSNRMMFPIPDDELKYNANASQADQNEYWRQK